jgi:glycosyltransferase involved in cell wall biosynthesis
VVNGSGGPVRDRVLWGTSFDAVPLSGVVVEFLKVADTFRDLGFRVHLDLGYDIKADKNRFFRPYDGHEAALLPPWVHLDRVGGLGDVDGYDAAFARDVLRDVATDGDRLLPRVRALSEVLAQRIIARWEALGVAFVVVENGTLPENITYTQALYTAIERYGTAHRLGRYVLWRDHDLMWSSEPGAAKYGAFPYRRTVRPASSPHVHYVTLHEEARRRMLEWAPGLSDVGVLPNTFTCVPAEVDEHNAGFRARFGIPEEAYLITRPSRLIRQKRVDRDIHLLAGVRDLLAARGETRPAYLLIAGDPAESPAEHAYLTDLAASLGVRDRVVFAGTLAPYDVPGTATPAPSVRDLFAHADLVTFLTSYDYESYGNPIGEAIAAGVPYAATRYQLYDTVYGGKGFRAPVMEISTAEDGLPPPEFVARVTDLLLDEAERREIAKSNHELGRLHFAPGRARDLVRRLCREAHSPRE